MSPAVRVRLALEGAGQAGVPCQQAWAAALDGLEDHCWRDALRHTAGACKRASALEPPTNRDLALDVLSRGIAEEVADLDAVHHCPAVWRADRAARARLLRSSLLEMAQARRELLAAWPRASANFSPGPSTGSGATSFQASVQGTLEEAAEVERVVLAWRAGVITRDAAQAAVTELSGGAGPAREREVRP